MTKDVTGMVLSLPVMNPSWTRAFYGTAAPMGRPAGYGLEVRGERWKLKGERWKVKTENWEVRGERWKVKTERWKVKGERWKVKGERWKVANSANSAKSAKIRTFRTFRSLRSASLRYFLSKLILFNSLNISELRIFFSHHFIVSTDIPRTLACFTASYLIKPSFESVDKIYPMPDSHRLLITMQQIRKKNRT